MVKYKYYKAKQKFKDIKFRPDSKEKKACPIWLVTGSNANVRSVNLRRWNAHKKPEKVRDISKKVSSQFKQNHAIVVALFSRNEWRQMSEDWALFSTWDGQEWVFLHETSVLTKYEYGSFQMIILDQGCCVQY